jgi:hypothetical protein
MKRVKLFEQFIIEAANIKDTAKNILDGLDSTAQLHVGYVPKEALSTIESSLKKNKSLSGKDAAKAAKEIRMNLEEIGILSNTFSPMDVEIIIMKHLNESAVNEAFIGPFVFNDNTDTEKLKEIYNAALDGYANWQKGFQYPKADYKKAYQEAEKILKKRGIKVDESLVNEAKFKVGDSWEWNHVDGVKIVTITDVKSNGDVVAKTEGESQDFIVRDANKYLKKKVNEGLNEATTSWSKMMKGVKTSESGPWSLVAHENGKVVGQKIDIRFKDALPAHFEAMRKEFPKAKIHIEDGTGMVVWNESSINESEKVIKGNFGVKKVQTLIDKYGRDNGLFFKRKSDGKLYGVGSLFLDTDNKDFAVIDADGDDEYIDYKDIDYVVIKESVVNEAKTLTREELMDLLENKYKIKTVRTSEEFNGQTEGIWVAGDNEEELSGNRIFYYYNRSAKYTNGILKQFRTAIEKTGWWFEWNDPGTIMIWPKNE